VAAAGARAVRNYLGGDGDDIEAQAPSPIKNDSYAQKESLWEQQRNTIVFEAYPEVKKMFIRRVYQILTLQLVFTFGFMWAFRTYVFSLYSTTEEDLNPAEPVENNLKSTPFQRFYAENASLVGNMLWSGIIGGFATLFALHFYQKRFPLNLVLLGAFTLCESIILAVGLLEIDGGVILQSLEITITVFVGLTVYATYTKEDYSWLRSYLFVGLWTLIFGGFLQFFFPLPGILDVAYSWGGALLFSLFIIYDTWRLHHQLRVDEYVVACVNLYLDFLNLFLKILRILSKKK